MCIRDSHRGPSQPSRGHLPTGTVLRCFHLAIWGAASWRPKLPCQSALGRSTALVGRWPREDSEGP
eukprot:8279026-Alexandrium_andersonii.AAC.1